MYSQLRLQALATKRVDLEIEREKINRRGDDEREIEHLLEYVDAAIEDTRRNAPLEMAQFAADLATATMGGIEDQLGGLS